MFKKIKIFLLVFLLSFSFGFSYSKAVDININLGNSNSSEKSLENRMIGNLEDKEKKSVVSSESKTIPGALKWARNLVLGLVMIITVGALVYTGIKLATSRGNPDEFKKTWMHLIYIIIGIFIIFASWGIVNLITKINIF